MEEIGKIIGEFSEGDWGRIRLISGVTKRGLYCKLGMAHAYLRSVARVCVTHVYVH